MIQVSVFLDSVYFEGIFKYHDGYIKYETYVILINELYIYIRTCIHVHMPVGGFNRSGIFLSGSIGIFLDFGIICLTRSVTT